MDGEEYSIRPWTYLDGIPQSINPFTIGNYDKLIKVWVNSQSKISLEKGENSQLCQHEHARYIILFMRKF